MPDSTDGLTELGSTLRPHPGSHLITHLAWSPDGRALASCYYDASVIHVWAADSGEMLRSLPSDAREGRSTLGTAWSPSGLFIASASTDTRIRVWNVETGKLHREFKAHTDWARSVVWRPDGKTLFSAADDKTILLWDVETSAVLKTLKGHSEYIKYIALSTDGSVLASGSDDAKVILWDAKTGKLLHTLKEHSGWVRTLAWMPGRRVLASGSSDRTIKLWDADTGQQLQSLQGHTERITGLSFSHDGSLMASKSFDGTVRLWRCDTWETVTVISEVSKRENVTSSPNLAFHPSEPILASLNEDDSVIRLWRLDIGVLLSSAPVVESVHYTTAKLALVGDNGVGKTGLGWRLAKGEFKEHPSTHGQQFWVIDELGATRADGTQCEAVLWDFAGQPDYRLVHALFLDDVDLALLLFDPTNRQEPLKGVEYWLKHLARERRDGTRRRVILVGGRADRGVPTLTREELEEFCRRQGVEAYVGTSALTGEGLEELLARVKSSIVWDEMPATVTTRTFKRVKEFVLALKANPERKGVLVSPEELRTRLEATDAEWQFTDAEMKTAVRHLSNHGYVSVLRGSSGEETILLAPDLLVNVAASFVLEARRNPKGLGALEEARVLAGGYGFPELASLEERERDVLLDAAVVLFIEHNLCFRETLGAQTLLIFPALINQKRPLLEEVETVDDVSYRVMGAVENVYAALVVQLGYTNTFTRTNQWQNQAEYETARRDVCGFRQVNEREGETELVLYYAKERAGARLLFQGLFEEFLRGRDVSVTKFPPVQCPVCDYRQQRAEVVKRIDGGKSFLFCGECGEKIELPKQGERVTLSAAERKQLGREQERTRRRTAFESALVRVKAVARDENKAAPRCFVSYAWGERERERWVRGLAIDLQNAGVDVLLDRNDNAWIGSNVGRFISRVEDEEVDFIAAVGTPLYLEKYRNQLSPGGSVVASEVDLINLRMMGTEQHKNTVLPLLAEGDPRDSFPPLLRGRVYADFREESNYFGALYELILTLYRIPFDHPAVSDLRDMLRDGSGRRR
ncbi:MAG: TIR domain-containing protein [Pyrinomonadaceae bacterium]